jgi:tight adherence protein C
MATRTAIYLYLSTALTLLSGLFLVIYRALPAPTQRTVERLKEVTRTGEATAGREVGAKKLGEISATVAAWLKSHVGLTIDPALQQRFVSAGLKGTTPGDLYQSARILGPLLGLLVGSMVPFARALWMMALPALAYLVPDLVVGHLVRSRRARIRRSIPDVVDLMVICVDAGLGLDQAMMRVAVELAISHPEASEEILQINREQRAGRLRGEAWQGMADRVKVPDVDAMVNMLMQTERFGTPIAKALGAFADGVRLKRRQAAEEMAAKSTIKIIFPLVLFIFPSIFIVLLGPAALNMLRVMGSSK